MKGIYSVIISVHCGREDYIFCKVCNCGNEGFWGLKKTGSNNWGSKPPMTDKKVFSDAATIYFWSLRLRSFLSILLIEFSCLTWICEKTLCNSYLVLKLSCTYHCTDFYMILWRHLKKIKTVPVNFVVNTILCWYCVYYEIYWNSLYYLLQYF